MHDHPTPPLAGEPAHTEPVHAELASRLAARSGELSVAITPVELVMQRGRQRQRRRGTAAGMLAVVAVCGTTITAVNLLSQPTEQRVSGATTPGDSADDSATTAAAGTQADAAPVSDVPAPIAGAINLVESNLVWNRVDPDSAEALGGTGFAMAGNGPFVAWSTAAGVPDNYTPTLYRSDDGQSWQAVIDGPGVSGGSLAEYGGRFYAFGTTPAAAAIPGARSDAGLATSDDGGLTWSTTVLPLDVTALAALDGVSSVGVSTMSITAGPLGVLAAVRVQPTIAWDELLPAEALTNGWGLDANGVLVYAPSPCVELGQVPTTIPGGPIAAPPVATLTTVTEPADVATATTVIRPATTTAAVDCVSTTATTTVGTTVTTIVDGATGDSTAAQPVGPEVVDTISWAELGIAPEAALALLDNQPRFFLAADGVTFEEVDAPVTGAEGSAIGDLRLASLPDRFVAWVATFRRSDGSPSSQLLESTDGRTWTDAGPVPVEYPDSLVALDGRLVLTGDGPDGGTDVATREADGTWTVVSMSALTVPSDGVQTSFGIGSISVGSTGITAIGTLFVDPVAEIGGVQFTRDGVVVSAADATFSNITFTDAATGSEIGRLEQGVGSSPLVEVSPTSGNVAIRLAEGGAVVATFTQEDLQLGLYGDLYSDAAPPDIYVVHSTDGVNWSRERLSDIAGAAISGTGGIRTTDTQVIVAANLADATTPGGAPRQVLLIGTPRI